MDRRGGTLSLGFSSYCLAGAERPAIRVLPEGPERLARLDAVLAGLAASSLEIPEVAFELIVLLRDLAGWQRTIAFIEELPRAIRRNAWVQEQYALAVSGAGDLPRAIGLLEELVRTAGDSPERSGLIGGRYRRLWQLAKKEREEKQGAAIPPGTDERRYLAKAIEAYTRGMQLDFNEYYCSGNVPPLLRARGGKGDLERAAIVEHFVVAACERARLRGSTDEWLGQTLLNAAFRSGDVDQAATLVDAVEREGPAKWKLEATMDMLRVAIDQTADAATRAELEGLYARLAELLPPRP